MLSSAISGTGPLAIVEVARQAGLARHVLGPGPGGVVLFRQRVGVFQPGARLGTARRSGRKAGRILIDRANHRSEKRRLRARQIVSAIGVEHRAVMLDLKEEVIHHALGQCFAVVGFQAKHDEVTVPAVHLVEAAAGNDVGIGQIEQPGRGQLLGTHVAQLLNAAGQPDHLNVAFLFESCHLRRRGNSAGR